jgi:hypothetical protein
VNAVKKEAHELRCRVCPCTPFLEVSTEVEACIGSVLDAYPQIKAGVECDLIVLEEHRDCVESALTCAEADACNAERDAKDDCPETSSPEADQAARDCVSME